MSDPSKKEREFDAYLGGESPLSKAYKEDARELPPAHLDAQVLAQARREGGGSGTKPARSPFSGSWMVPASLTAAVVLAVSVAVLLPQGRPGHERQRDRFEDTAAPEAEPTGTGEMRQRESKQAPAMLYAPAPPEVLESDGMPSTAPSPEDSPLSTDLEPKSLLPKEAQRSAPAAADRPDADSGADSVGIPSSELRGMKAEGEEGLAGSARSEAVSDAAAWIARIESLIDRGELEAARKTLAEFRRLYPGTEVPQGIIESLGGE
ncbi:MAG TPA: hypothetical protein VLS27_07230 [Gammaproteobacteria bacterium]|nr:hypothetical protein [Gammaproteobacteria bacterium]